MKEHREIVHEKTRHSCDRCDYKAAKVGNLKMHQRLHKGIKYYCDNCEYKTMWQKALVPHQNTEHRNNNKTLP